MVVCPIEGLWQHVHEAKQKIGGLMSFSVCRLTYEEFWKKLCATVTHGPSRDEPQNPDIEKQTKVIEVDLIRAMYFIGEDDKKIIYDLSWRRAISTRNPMYYAQGDFTGRQFHDLPHSMLRNEKISAFKGNPGEEKLFLNSHTSNDYRFDFMYINDEGTPCGITLHYDLANNGDWTIFAAKNTHAPETEQLISVIAGENSYIKNFSYEDKQLNLPFMSVNKLMLAQQLEKVVKSKQVMATLKAVLNEQELKQDALAKCTVEGDLITLPNTETYKSLQPIQRYDLEKTKTAKTDLLNQANNMLKNTHETHIKNLANDMEALCHDHPEVTCYYDRYLMALMLLKNTENKNNPPRYLLKHVNQHKQLLCDKIDQIERPWQAKRWKAVITEIGQFLLSTVIFPIGIYSKVTTKNWLIWRHSKLSNRIREEAQQEYSRYRAQTR